MSRDLQQNESLGTTSTTSTTFSDVHSLSFTPQASTTYVILWSGSFKGTTAVECQLKFLHGSTDLETLEAEVKDPADDNGYCYVSFYTAPASPTSQTFKTQIASETGGTSVSCANNRIIALALDALDQTASSDGQQSTSSSTDTDALTKSFTPGSSGDYLILAYCSAGATQTGTQQVGIKLDVDGTNETAGWIETEASGMNWPWFSMVKKTLDASSHSIKVKFNSNDNATTVYAQRFRILALRLDTLDNAYYAENRSETSTTSTSFVNHLTTSPTPENKTHLILHGAMLRSNSTSDPGHYQFQEGGVTNVTLTRETQVNDANYRTCHMGMYAKTLAASSTTFAIQIKADSAGTEYIDDAAIAILQTEEAASPPPPPPPQPPSGGAFVMCWWS